MHPGSSDSFCELNIMILLQRKITKVFSVRLVKLSKRAPVQFLRVKGENVKLCTVAAEAAASGDQLGLICFKLQIRPTLQVAESDGA